LKSTALFRAIELYRIELSQATEDRYLDAVALQVEAAELLVVRAVTVKRRLSRGVWLLTEQLADLRPGGKPPDAI
jgi:DNA-directed RNA polymerase specialized sigma24 family protein